MKWEINIKLVARLKLSESYKQASNRWGLIARFVIVKGEGLSSREAKKKHLTRQRINIP